jgi:predicted nucleic acid-binding protein
MKNILVDTSAWIEYFRGSKAINSDLINSFIDNNQICINDLILSELIPSLKHKKERDLIDILLSIRNIPIEINWQEIINYQIINLKHGINNVGIPDIIILQNIISNNLSLISFDKHFNQMKKNFDFSLIDVKK